MEFFDSFHTSVIFFEILHLELFDDSRNLSFLFVAGRQALWLDGGIHAREWIAPATMLHFIDQVKYASSLPLLYKSRSHCVESKFLHDMKLGIA